MENQIQYQPAEAEGLSTATVVFGGIFILAVGGILWYVLSPKGGTTVPAIGGTSSNQSAWATNPNNPANQPLAGAGGQKAVGVLTDPNFFSGLTNLATTIAGLVKDGKANGQLTQSNVGFAPGGNIDNLLAQQNATPLKSI